MFTIFVMTALHTTVPSDLAAYLGDYSGEVPPQCPPGFQIENLRGPKHGLTQRFLTEGFLCADCVCVVGSKERSYIDFPDHYGIGRHEGEPYCKAHGGPRCLGRLIAIAVTGRTQLYCALTSLSCDRSTQSGQPGNLFLVTN